MDSGYVVSYFTLQKYFLTIVLINNQKTMETYLNHFNILYCKCNGREKRERKDPRNSCKGKKKRVKIFDETFRGNQSKEEGRQ